MSRRLSKWLIELDEYDICYKQRRAIKAHLITNFITELPVTLEEQVLVYEDCESKWDLFVDGALGMAHQGADTK